MFSSTMKGRVFYLIKYYFTLVIIFILMKPVFMLFNKTGHDFGVGDMWDVVAHGVTLDLSTALYLIVVPFLCIVCSIWINRWMLFRKVLKVYNCLLALMLTVIFIADTSLYSFWGYKLDATVLDYLDTTGDAFASVSVWYVVERVLIFVVAVIPFSWLLTKLSPAEVSRLCPRQRIFGAAMAVVFIPLFVIGIRGGISTATTNIGQVYYSSDQFLNHSAVNPAFSIFSTMWKSDADKADYRFFSDKECTEMMNGVYDTRSLDGDSLLNTEKPNVLIILMEGCGGSFTEIGGHPEIMPNLNRLAHEGVYFTNCYGNSYRTDRGTVCALSGYPSFPLLSVMKHPAKSRTLPSIANSLARLGYVSDFLYGGDVDFTNMRSYLLSTGYQHITSDDDYSVKLQHSGKWGVPDNFTFATLYDMLSHRNGEKPWMTTFLTLSSHEPWNVPIRRFHYEVYNSFAFLDDCIGKFIDKFRRTPQWKNTLIVILPDHGIRYPNLEETDQLRNHIPMIWTGGAVRRAKRIEQICNQTDLAATLLGQMGVRHDDFTFSRDVSSSTYQRTLAIHTYNNGFSVVDDHGFTVYDLDSGRTLFNTGDYAQKRIALGKAILQTASNDINNRK